MKQAISSFRINLYMVAATICLHGAMMVMNCSSAAQNSCKA
jgi:hypothetical protein